MKQYKCDLCSYSGARSRDLVKHKTKHTGENLHKCDVCSYSSIRFCDLVRHRKNIQERNRTSAMCVVTVLQNQAI